MIPSWQKDWSWWKRFKYNWIPKEPDEWGCAGCCSIMLVFLILFLILVFSVLVRGIGWVWGF